MRIITVNAKPYTVINGKDFAVYRWFHPGPHGPLFIQVAGRTSLTREDLPTDDWIVLQTRAGVTRISTAWRKPWFDYKPDATRKLAFLGASTSGSFYLALRYLVRRFGITTEEVTIAARASDLASGIDAPYGSIFEKTRDTALTETELVTLDVPSSFDAAAVVDLLGIRDAA
ncbi:MAG: hypothetical protein AABO58_00800 [Acidobacteriota bacterium]